MRQGAARLFGPVMGLWFTTIGACAHLHLRLVFIPEIPAAVEELCPRQVSGLRRARCAESRRRLSWRGCQ